MLPYLHIEYTMYDFTKLNQRLYMSIAFKELDGGVESRIWYSTSKYKI